MFVLQSFRQYVVLLSLDEAEEAVERDEDRFKEQL
jgi:hypothetical protein